MWKSATAAGLFAFSGSVRARQQPIVSASSFARVVRSLACAGVSPLPRWAATWLWKLSRFWHVCAVLPDRSIRCTVTSLSWRLDPSLPSLAEVAELLGDSTRVAADHYVYALTDYREVDRSIVLTQANP